MKVVCVKQNYVGRHVGRRGKYQSSLEAIPGNFRVQWQEERHDTVRKVVHLSLDLRTVPILTVKKATKPSDMDRKIGTNVHSCAGLGAMVL